MLGARPPRSGPRANPASPLQEGPDHRPVAQPGPPVDSPVTPAATASSRLRPRARAHTPLPSAPRRPPRRAGLREWHGAPVPRLGPTPDLGASGLSLGLRLPEALRLSLSLTSPGQNRDRILARPGRVPWKVAYLQLESEATTRAAAARTVTWCATWTVSRTALAQWPQPGPWKRLT